MLLSLLADEVEHDLIPVGAHDGVDQLSRRS
jgi:hypothetical protein